MIRFRLIPYRSPPREFIHTIVYFLRRSWTRYARFRPTQHKVVCKLPLKCEAFAGPIKNKLFSPAKSSAEGHSLCLMIVIPLPVRSAPAFVLSPLKGFHLLYSILPTVNGSIQDTHVPQIWLGADCPSVPLRTSRRIAYQGWSKDNLLNSLFCFILETSFFKNTPLCNF